MQNRGIKFRIFDGTKFHYSGGTPSMLRSFFEQTAVFNTRYGYPYEQLTGIDDRNGLELYEGDIVARVQFDYEHEHTYECFDSKGERVCDMNTYEHQPIRHGYSCGFVGWLWGDRALPVDIDRKDRLRGDFVISGNIHESPELLNASS